MAKTSTGLIVFPQVVSEVLHGQTFLHLQISHEEFLCPGEIMTFVCTVQHLYKLCAAIWTNIAAADVPDNSQLAELCVRQKLHLLHLPQSQMKE